MTRSHRPRDGRASSLPSSRRRVLSEHVPFANLARPELLDALAARFIELLVAVRPGEEHELRALSPACRAHGVRLGVWPMLADRDGRWASERNADAFAGFADDVLAALGEDARPDVLVLDLEPPIREVRAVLRSDPRVAARWLARRADAEASAVLAACAQRARDRGIETLATVVAPLGTKWGRAYEDVLATPLTAIAPDRVAPMLYTSLFEGYTRGVLTRGDARSLFYELARATNAFVGPTSAVCLGAVGLGALGDERVYRSVAELAEDVSLARAAGVDDLLLFDLAGVLARPPIAPWLDALVATDAAMAEQLPSMTWRVRTLLTAVRAGARALSAAQPFLRA